MHQTNISAPQNSSSANSHVNSAMVTAHAAWQRQEYVYLLLQHSASIAMAAAIP
jgi:hypothetical protein